MRSAAALLGAALVLTGCGGSGTSNGFSAEPPGGWEDRTDVAETRTGGEFEVVWEGARVQGVTSSLTVSRVKVPKGGSADSAVRAARKAVAARDVESGPIVEATLAGERALRFDYAAQGRRARYLTALHTGHLYAVTVQTAASGFDRGLAVLNAYLASWRWDA